MSDRQFTIYEIHDHVARLTLNRPDKKNALHRTMRKEVQEAFRDIKNNQDVWLAIFTGLGDVFCAGKDLAEKIDPADDDGSVFSNDDLFLYQRKIFKPIIVALNGPALAQGAGFVLSSDIIIMSDRSSVGWPQVSRGIASGTGPSQGVHAMPWAQAMGYMLRAKTVPPEDALRLGIANEVVAHDDLMDCAERWAGEIMANAPLAVRGIKEAARRGQDLELEARMRLARDIADRVVGSDDATEGIQAFKEKRKPQWSGR